MSRSRAKALAHHEKRSRAPLPEPHAAGTHEGAFLPATRQSSQDLVRAVPGVSGVVSLTADGVGNQRANPIGSEIEAV
jgi:hypothetical protein